MGVSPTGTGTGTDTGGAGEDGAAGVLSAVDKAMLVLTTLATAERPLSLTQLTRRTRLARATVHRLVGTLLAHRVAVRLDDGYAPGPYLTPTPFGPGAEPLALLRRESTPYLVELYRATGHTASVTVLDAAGARHVHQVHGHRSYRLPEHIPAGTPAEGDVIAKVIAAYSPRLVAGVAGCVDVDELAEIRRTGVAAGDDRVRDVSSVAVPIPGRQAAALAVTGRRGTLDVAAAAAALRHSGFALARTLRAATTAAGPIAM